jgi:cation:H+ antiporter
MWLLIGYVTYLIYVFNRGSDFKAHESLFQTGNWARKTALLFFSVALMLISAQVLVKYSIGLGELVHIPAIFIGLTLTAAGTSLPELVFGLKVMRTKLKNEIMGNVLGSVVVNSTLVIGATAVINPIKRETADGNISILFLALSLILFIAVSLSGRRISRFEAILLTMFYIMFLFVEKRLAGL